MGVPKQRLLFGPRVGMGPNTPAIDQSVAGSNPEGVWPEHL